MKKVIIILLIVFGAIVIGLSTWLIIDKLVIAPKKEPKEATIQFYTNSETGQELSDKVVTIGDTIRKPYLEREQRGDVNSGVSIWEVSGWYVDYQLTEPWDFEQPVEKDMALYAKWEMLDSVLLLVHFDGIPDRYVNVVPGELIDFDAILQSVKQTLGITELPFVSARYYTDSNHNYQFTQETLHENAEIYMDLYFDEDGVSWSTQSFVILQGKTVDLSEVEITLSYNNNEYKYNYDSNSYAWTVDMPADYSEKGEYTIKLKFCNEYTNNITLSVLEPVAEKLSIFIPSEKEYYYKSIPDYKTWFYSVTMNDGQTIDIPSEDISIVMPEIVESGTYEVTLVCEKYNISTTQAVTFYTEQSGNYFNFSIIQGVAILSSISDEGRTMTDLVVPSQYEGYDVVMIDANAFKDAQTLRNIYLPSTISLIGNGAFAGCSELQKVGLVDGDINITKIGASTFSGCVSLTEIEFWDKVTVVEERAFENCSSFAKDLQNLRSIGDYAFMGCNSIDTINLDYFNTVGEGAFSNILSDGLKIVWENNLSINVNESTFNGTNINTVQFNLDNVTQEKLVLFKAMPTLANWIIVGNVPDEFLKENTFIRYLQLINTTKVGKSAFQGCTYLQSVSYINEASNNLVINAYAFADCSALSAWGDNNTIDDASLKEKAFYGCSFQTLALKNVTLSEHSAFENNSSLTAVELNGVMVINAEGTFRNCVQLTSVSGSVDNLSDQMFYGCGKLSDYTLSVSKSYGSNVFYGTAIKTLKIDSGVESLAQDALVNVSLETITVEPDNANFIVEAGILYDKAYTTIYKAEASIDLVQITIKDSVSLICDRAFENLSKSITLVMYRYVPPTLGDEWNYGSDIRIECNPFNSVQYEQVFGSETVAPINSSVYYCITFDPRFGANDIKSYLVLATNSTITSDMRPTQEAYKDITLGEDNAKDVTFPFKATGNMLLVAGAGWKISYDLEDDTTVPDNAPLWVRDNSQVVTLPDASRPNYVFVGWQLPDGTQIDKGSEITYNEFTENIVLSPVWQPQWNITYESEFGINLHKDSPLYLREGQTVELLPATSTGYHIFEGWLLNGNKVDTLDYSQLDSDITLTALWTIRRKVNYVVDSGVNVTILPTQQYLMVDQPVTLPIPSLTNYEFAGWQLADGTFVTTLNCQDYTSDTVTVTAKWWGTASYPYLISTASELSTMLSKTQEKYYFKLTNDIDLGDNWVPISNFVGYFDGNGKTLTYSAYIPASTVTSAQQSMIGVVSQNNGKISNLTVNASIYAESYHDSKNWIHVGGIAGINYGTIEYCNVQIDANVHRYNSTAGGIAGKSSAGSVITNCVSMGSIFGNGNIGGIAGETDTATISSCQVSLMDLSYYYVNANRGVGGIVGYAHNNTSVTNNSAYRVNISYENPLDKNGNITPYMGTIVGYLSGSSASGNNSNYTFIDKGTLTSWWSWFVTYDQTKYVGGDIGRKS